MGLERHRPQESAHRSATDLPVVAKRQEISERSDRPALSRDPELLGRLHHERGQLLPNLGLDFRRAARLGPITEPVEASGQISLQPAAHDLMLPGCGAERAPPIGGDVSL